MIETNPLTLKRLTKTQLIEMVMGEKSQNDSLAERLDAYEEQRLRLVNQRTLDESKIHQLQTALDGAVRARTQALEDLDLARQRGFFNSEADKKVLMLTEQVDDLRKVLALLDRVIK